MKAIQPLSAASKNYHVQQTNHQSGQPKTTRKTYNSYFHLFRAETKTPVKPIDLPEKRG